MSDLFEKPIWRVSNQMLWSLLLNKWIKRRVDFRLFCRCGRTQAPLRKATCLVPQIAAGSERYLCSCKAEYFTVIQSCKRERNWKLSLKTVLTCLKVFRFFFWALSFSTCKTESKQPALIFLAFVDLKGLYLYEMYLALDFVSYLLIMRRTSLAC